MHFVVVVVVQSSRWHIAADDQLPMQSIEVDVVMDRVVECDHVVAEHGHEMLHWNVVGIAIVGVHGSDPVVAVDVQLMVHWSVVDTVVVVAEGAVFVAVGGQQIVCWLVVVVVLNVH